ncbi:hypothetical protein [Nitratireductor sp. L15S-10]|uniref:hypothetical protein n=1 Tax=Nitratireductor sp. L15S-10 TaxID=3034028 RepID=UPI0038572162
MLKNARRALKCIALKSCFKGAGNAPIFQFYQRRSNALDVQFSHPALVYCLLSIYLDVLLLCAAVYMSFIDVYGGYPVELYLFDNAFLSRSPWRMPEIKEGYGRQPESCFSGRWCQHTERWHVAWRTRKAAAAAKPQARRLRKF